MALKFLNRVRMSMSGAPGSGVVTLGTQATGFQTFNNAGMSDGDTTPYLIEDGAPLGSAWELGLGTWHANGTFSRTLITQSSAGGTSPINVSSAAVISAIFRAGDLTGISALAALSDTNIVSPTNGQLLKFNATNGKWENRTVGGSSPAVVQYTYAQANTGAVSMTLPTAPTVGNYVITIGNGGGGFVSSVYGSGFVPIYQDKTGSFSQINQYECNYAIKAVRSGDSAGPYSVGSVNASGVTLNAVMVEVSGIDITRCSEFQMNLGLIGAASFTLDVVTQPNALALMFGGGDPHVISVTSPTPQVLSNAVNGSSLMFAYNNALNGWNGLVAQIASGGFGALVMSLPGV